MACSCCSLGMSFSISACRLFGVDFGNPKEEGVVFSGMVVEVVCVDACKCKGIPE